MIKNLTNNYFQLAGLEVKIDLLIPMRDFFFIDLQQVDLLKSFFEEN